MFVLPENADVNLSALQGQWSSFNPCRRVRRISAALPRQHDIRLRVSSPA
jgi:uncharacterized protein YhdP